MAITGVQLIYRLKDTVRLFIDYRTGPTPDSYNLYWSSTSGGVYAVFATGIVNKPSTNSASRGKIVFEFTPSTIVGWSNTQDNFIKLTTVTGGVESAQEGPMTIPTREELIKYAEKSLMYGFNKASQTFIVVAVDPDGKLITTV